MQFTFTTVNWLLHLAAASTVCGVLLECGCEYYGSSVDAAGGRGSVDAAGGRGSVEKINSRWRRLPRVYLSH